MVMIACMVLYLILLQFQLMNPSLLLCMHVSEHLHMLYEIVTEVHNS